VVKNLDGEKGKVTWGAGSKTFTKAELEAGINLAAEFLDNPFVESFRKVEGMIAQKQNFETVMIKQTINSFPRLLDATGKDKQLEASLEALRGQLFETQQKLGGSVRTAMTPVKHTITVVAEK